MIQRFGRSASELCLICLYDNFGETDKSKSALVKPDKALLQEAIMISR